MTFSFQRWFFALGVVSACGGRVVVDTNDGGGGEAGGQAGGSAVSACKAFCDAYAMSCPTSGSCHDDCLERASYAGPCEAEHEAWLLCGAAQLPIDPAECTKPLPACQKERDAIDACVYPPGACETPVCSTGGTGSEAAMTCTFACGGVVYTSACGKPGSTDFPKECTCQIDGETVGTCQSVTKVGVFWLGCCSAYFAESQ